MAEQTQHAGQFYTLLNMTEEEDRNQRGPLLERQVKRQLSSAYDSAEQQKLTAENAIRNAYAVVRKITSGKELDINDILGHRMKIAELTNAQNYIKSEYKYLFGEELPTT